MKNQFNISLGNFDIEKGSKEWQDLDLHKMSLKYVKPSIIESLFQEMDMLSWCLYLNDVWTQSPVTPLDENIFWTISQFDPGISNAKVNTEERSFDYELHHKNSFYRNEPSSKI